jgi:DNA-binding winged helix-turn-helix (wHTH) protein
LNTTIKKIRTALGDSAENPRFIETLLRSGYRLIVPVQRAAGQDAVGERRAAERVLLAVLPFKNLVPSRNRNTSATEEMIAHLGMLAPRTLGVIAGTLVMR